jgi:carbon storage regulator CsrA
MLVLTRRIGEEIVIAGTIRVMLVSVKKKQVRLGITAPPTVPVMRMELLATAPLRCQQLGESGDGGEAGA